MDFEHSDRSLELQARVEAFMIQHVYPVEQLYYEQGKTGEARAQPEVLQKLKALAKAQGLWNLFLTGEEGPGLTNLEYAPVKEIMGRVLWGPEVFNCAAPNVGNMEILSRFGTPEQKERWLAPMLAGEMKSAFSMTEPEVASSDATNIRCDSSCGSCQSRRKKGYI